jgi:succinyl-diaminopimelate desuccinylase
MNETLALLKDLIRRESITPNDAGCQDLIAERLTKIPRTLGCVGWGE